MSKKYLVLTFLGSISLAANAYGANVVPPLPPRPLPSMPVKEAKITEQESLLLKAQIEMLKEAKKQADVCHKMGKDTARKGAKDPAVFDKIVEQDESSGSSPQVFPTGAESIFKMSPVYNCNNIDPKKMDHQVFVTALKDQKNTTKTLLADILVKVLGWKDISKIESYRNSISQDLRALSSFCTGPIKILEEAITYRKDNPTPEKKPSFLQKIRDKFKKN